MKQNSISGTIHRREFLSAAIMALLGGVAITVTGCGNYGSPAQAPQTADGKAGSITDNHGHAAVITSAQLTAQQAISLDIRGDADHTHTVSLSAAGVRAISSGQRLSFTSTTTDGHAHQITFN